MGVYINHGANLTPKEIGFQYFGKKVKQLLFNES